MQGLISCDELALVSHMSLCQWTSLWPATWTDCRIPKTTTITDKCIRFIVNQSGDKQVERDKQLDWTMRLLSGDTLSIKQCRLLVALTSCGWSSSRYLNNSTARDNCRLYLFTVGLISATVVLESVQCERYTIALFGHTFHFQDALFWNCLLGGAFWMHWVHNLHSVHNSPFDEQSQQRFFSVNQFAKLLRFFPVLCAHLSQRQREQLLAEIAYDENYRFLAAELADCMSLEQLQHYYREPWLEMRLVMDRKSKNVQIYSPWPCAHCHLDKRLLSKKYARTGTRTLAHYYATDLKTASLTNSDILALNNFICCLSFSFQLCRKAS